MITELYKSHDDFINREVKTKNENMKTPPVKHMVPERPSFKEFCVFCHELAKAKGFHDELDDDKWLATACNNLHGEVQELWDAARAGKLHDQCDKKINLSCQEEEIADIIIRAFDMAERLKINLDVAIALKLNYNIGREYKHGKLN